LLATPILHLLARLAAAFRSSLSPMSLIAAPAAPAASSGVVAAPASQQPAAASSSQTAAPPPASALFGALERAARTLAGLTQEDERWADLAECLNAAQYAYRVHLAAPWAAIEKRRVLSIPDAVIEASTGEWTPREDVGDRLRIFRRARDLRAAHQLLRMLCLLASTRLSGRRKAICRALLTLSNSRRGTCCARPLSQHLAGMDRHRHTPVPLELPRRVSRHERMPSHAEAESSLAGATVPSSRTSTRTA
jgi:hypothetical protein